MLATLYYELVTQGGVTWPSYKFDILRAFHGDVVPDCAATSRHHDITMSQTDHSNLGRAALHTHNLEVSYAHRGGTIKALQRNSLSIEQGAFVVLLGASGAGKSTLLRTLNGLVRPTSGSVIAEGIGDLAERGALRRHRRQTGMVFQQHHLIGRLSVLHNVLMGRLGYHGGWSTLMPWSRPKKRTGARRH